MTLFEFEFELIDAKLSSSSAQANWISDNQAAFEHIYKLSLNQAQAEFEYLIISLVKPSFDYSIFGSICLAYSLSHIDWELEMWWTYII